MLVVQFSTCITLFIVTGRCYFSLASLIMLKGTKYRAECVFLMTHISDLIRK